ncbi:hypothetical protein ATCV1_z515R [Acanthocystis turfacea chlorella virus 1]|uniref:Uncharacterized protein z515R n=1 Tax=Chlorovirus heliozoae TaxID=322019 RepID=A7K9C5_9PHYC|nr:hypothetical protein ATCV1_z515R [Acanthocystis turfacea chlorella virus 1]ABT16649.1 hypothetical protein ATCV1_z515R [Acanthocystis turfacea chlorella virus 1]
MFSAAMLSDSLSYWADASDASWTAFSTTASALASSCFRSSSKAFVASMFFWFASAFDNSAATIAFFTSSSVASPLTYNWVAVCTFASSCAEVAADFSAAFTITSTVFWSISPDIDPTTSEMIWLLSLLFLIM